MTAPRLRRTSFIAIVAAAIAFASAKVLIVSLQLSLSGQVVLVALALMLACAATCAVSMVLDRHTQHRGTNRSDLSAPPRRSGQ